MWRNRKEVYLKAELAPHESSNALQNEGCIVCWLHRESNRLNRSSQSLTGPSSHCFDVLCVGCHELVQNLDLLAFESFA